VTDGATVLPARQHTIRTQNLGLVLRQIAANPGQSRAQLATATGLTRTTISALVDELIDRNLIAEQTPGRGARGRPASPLALNPQGPAGLGIEINVDYLAGCIVDLTGAVRAHRTVAADNRGGSPRVGLQRAATLARQLIEEVDLPIAGVTVALPGLVDADGTLRRAPNLPTWQGTRCATQLSELLELPVSVDNEANLAALAQLWHDSALPDFVLVSGEIGVGAGLVMDGRLFRGVRGMAGELGHVVVHPDGPPCGCGANGCLEQFAGQEALLRRAGLLDRSPGSAQNPDSAGAALVRRAEAGDGRTREALAEAGQALGIALAALINTLDLPAVVLGGLYARLGEWLVAPISAELGRRVISAGWAPPTVLISALGIDAAVRGAAGVAVSHILDGVAVPG
jgi:predicted NBD/HSP70 family sugar kinase